MTLRDARQLLAIFVLFAGLSTAPAATAAAPRVPGFERLSIATKLETDHESAIRGGLLLLSELNCVACHAAESSIGIAGKQAPRLDDVGTRVRRDYLREFLSNPARADAGTTMPHLLQAATEEQQKQQVESLVHFLSSSSSLSESAPVTAGVQQGKKLFHSVGCLACHDVQQDHTAELATSVPLANLSRKYSIPSLSRFLHDPLHVRPSGRMPQLNLTHEESRDIACFLLRDLKIPASLTYQYYEGNWDSLPEFDKLPVKASGEATSFDVNLRSDNHFAIRFQGTIRVEKAGSYRFALSSDDGSRLRIDGQEVIVNDHVHPLTTKEGKVSLTAGDHALVVEYFEGGGEQELRVEYEGPGVARQSVEFELIPLAGMAAPARFIVDPALALQGRHLFESAGCAACHAMQLDGQKLVPQRLGKKLSLLTSGGCLSETPQPGLPFFSINRQQRTALTSVLEALRGGQRPLATGPVRVDHMLGALNCYACHERGGVGGVELNRNPHFQSNQPEMGDEGRLPPSLTGVGAKLRPEWLRQVLEQGAKDRPYMLTRMPKFGRASAELLPADFLQLDRSPSATPPSPTTPERTLKAAGRQLVGERGLSCVKCHTWGNIKATGIQAISLTTMTRRLDPGWFRRYLLNPQLYRAGTRMPAVWPNGQSSLANILDGDALRQLHAVWTYLADAEQAAMPLGIGQQSIELVADKEPILYRNFLAGAGTRAIGVGYPERLNLAFDANECRLAMVWQGAFLDASLHWVGRGSGFQRPLGDHVIQLPDGPPLAMLTSIAEAWPGRSAREPEVRFRGYRLDAERRPVFLYRWHQCDLEEAIQPATSQEGGRLQRTIRVTTGPSPTAWFRAMVANRIADVGNGWFVVDEDWKLRIESAGGKPIVRVSQGKQELLVPFSFTTTGESPTVEIEMVW